NAAQWDIVRALADPNRPGGLFVVGDPKQSIYAFRGADVSVFAAVRRAICAVGGQEVALARSFRAHQPLVNCFNDLFGRLLTRDDHSTVRDYQIAYDTPMSAHRADAPNTAPALELLLISRDDAPSDTDNQSDEIRRLEARALAWHLRRIVEVEQRLIWDKAQKQVRPATYGDITLLFRAMTHVTLYEAVFKAAGLPFVTIAGRGYYDRQEIWDLLNLLRALYHPADHLSLAAALRSPLFGFSDDALLALRLDSSVGLWEALRTPPAHLPAEDQVAVTFAAQTLTDLRGMAGRVTIAELLRAALEATGYLATLTGLPDGTRRRGNVEKLLEKARSSGKITLGAFSQYLDDLSAREVREGEALLEVADAVRLMTVHSSKGLEFPIVGLVDASRERSRRDTAMLTRDPAVGWACRVYDAETQRFESPFAYRRAQVLHDLRDEAESRRLLYVAATRAGDHLLVSGQTRTNADGLLTARGWLGWLIDALELQDHVLQDDTVVPYTWGEARVMFPNLADLDEMPAAVEPLADWDQTPLPFAEVQPPALLAHLHPEPDAPARSMTASQIADLGGAVYGTPDTQRAAHEDRWRRGVLQAAPAYIPAVSGKDRTIPQRTLGEIVHKALQWWQSDATEDEVRELLRCYAWEEGVVEVAAREAAATRAYDLLRKVLNSDLHQRLLNASQVFREVPVVYQTDKRLIHGIIDVLFQRPDGVWVVVDYKTSFVAAQPDMAQLQAHARRYHLQVGVYAQAVAALLHIEAPDVYIHYIAHEQTVAVAPDAWRGALAQLEDHIGKLTGLTHT
ncbi:MAG: UvrD-helicase domain-containing protein, partial [Chloroflexi bacterium]|nr:UvrD-helicase domain-containing protein [Chloroflexota bacterium]